MRRLALIARVVLLCSWTLPAIAQTPAAPTAAREKEERIVIAGKEFVLVPREKWQARGLDLRDVPRERNAFWQYVEAINAMTELPADLQESFNAAARGEWPEGEERERLTAWLVDNQAALDLARQAAAMPDYALPLMVLPGSDVTLSSVMLPSLSAQRQLARLLALEAVTLRDQGQSDAAMENYLSMQRMGNHIGSGSLLIEGLVGIAITSQAEQGVIRLVESDGVSPEVLRAALTEMEQLADTQPDWPRMLEAERRFGETFIDDAMDTPGGLWLMSSGVIVPPERYEPNGWSELVRRLKRLYLPDRTIRKQLREHYAALAAAGKPREDGTVIAIEEDSLFRKIPTWNFPTRMVLPSLSRAYELMLMNRSNFERARLSVAAAAYRADHGAPPPSLAVLAPAYVASIPIDPMTGYDFEYQIAAEAKAGYKGLEQVTRDNEAELLKKRKAPAILSPRASRWRRYVVSVCERYQFTERQRSAAEAILRDMETRAAQYEQAQGVKLMELVEAGQSDELARKIGPLDQMFNELKQRLENLPDAKQRAAAKQAASQPTSVPEARPTRP